MHAFKRKNVNFTEYKCMYILRVRITWFVKLHASPNHRKDPHLRSHRQSLLWTFTPDLKFSWFTNPFLHSLSGSTWTAFSYLGLSGHWRVFGFSFFILYFLLVTCARLSWTHWAFQSKLNSFSSHILQLSTEYCRKCRDRSVQLIRR